MNAADIAAAVKAVRPHLEVITDWTQDRAGREPVAAHLIDELAADVVAAVLSLTDDDLHDLHPQPGDAASPVPAGVEGWAAGRAR